jgi:hypothetical protein
MAFLTMLPTPSARPAACRGLLLIQFPIPPPPAELRPRGMGLTAGLPNASTAVPLAATGSPTGAAAPPGGKLLKGGNIQRRANICD